MTDAERIAALEAENTRLRAALAQSKSACVYCSLPADEWAKCASGFPGCDRADDAMGCPELGARMELTLALSQRDRAVEAEREACIADIKRAPSLDENGYICEKSAAIKTIRARSTTLTPRNL